MFDEPWRMLRELFPLVATLLEKEEKDVQVSLSVPMMQVGKTLRFTWTITGPPKPHFFCRRTWLQSHVSILRVVRLQPHGANSGCCTVTAQK